MKTAFAPKHYVVIAVVIVSHFKHIHYHQEKTRWYTIRKTLISKSDDPPASEQ